jgi:serine/threonine-protein kinase
MTAQPVLAQPERRAATLAGVLAGRYVLDGEIGRGGMAIVYLARQLRFGRSVAIKIPSSMAEEAVEHVRGEIRTMARLDHPHILPLLDADERRGLPCFVMRYVRGGSLRALVTRRGRLPFGEAAALLRGTAAALQYAHDRDILHCDVKPENILLDEGHPYLADFGVARPPASESAVWRRPRLVSGGGTPTYVSPEQAAGDHLDARSDVYSLACVAYEMLAGRSPFLGDTAAEIVARRFGPAAVDLGALPRKVPARVVRVIERALSVAPEDRPESVTAFTEPFASAKRRWWRR